jgi:hypothetical protein
MVYEALEPTVPAEGLEAEVLRLRLEVGDLRRRLALAKQALGPDS